MAKLGIFTGTYANDGTGDTLLDAVVKINNNFTELYTTFGDGTNLIGGNSGIADYATIAGYSTSSGVSTSATIAGYATTSGIATLAQGLTGTPNIVVGVSTLGVVSATSLNVTGIITANSFRPSSGYYQSPNGTNAFYVYDTSGDVSFQGKIVTNYIRSNTNLNPTITVSDLDLQFARNLTVSGITTSTGGFVGNLTGTATNSGYATIAGYSTSSGVSTSANYATIAGYSTSSGVSTSANYATIAGYSTSSGISTSVIGGISSVTQLSVSGVSTFAGITTVTGQTLFSKQFWASGISSFSSSVYFANNATLYIGNGLNFVNDGTTSTITENGPGNLIINSNGGSIRIRLNNTDSIVANEGSSADLYHNGSKKLNTTSTGITVTDDITVGGATSTTNLYVTGVTTITGNLNAAGNSYVKLARTTNQTITNGADALIGFSVVSDPNSWYSGITTRTTPTVAGTYHVDLMINWQAGSITNNQTNIQIRKNGNTFALSQSGIHTFAYTMNACGIVTMNGTTDYIDCTVYTSNPTSQVVNGTADGAWTKMEIFKIN
jgi:hypothetical protein